MTEESNKEICKAFAYNVPVGKIAEIMGVDREELDKIRENSGSEIDIISSYYSKLNNKEE